MSEETTQPAQEDPKPAKPAKAAPAAKAAPSPFAPNVRRSPQPKPMVVKAPPPPPREGTRERHRYDRAKEGKAVPEWMDAAAAAMNRWPNGAELSREDYDKAIEAAGQITVR